MYVIYFRVQVWLSESDIARSIIIARLKKNLTTHSDPNRQIKKTISISSHKATTPHGYIEICTRPFPSHKHLERENSTGKTWGNTAARSRFDLQVFTIKTGSF